MRRDRVRAYEMTPRVQAAGTASALATWKGLLGRPQDEQRLRERLDRLPGLWPYCHAG